jgi:hypothetical protein
LGFQIGVLNWGPKSGFHNWYSYTEEVSDEIEIKSNPEKKHSLSFFML